MRVEQYLEESAQRHATKTAIVAGDRRVTYADLQQQAARVAALLRASGVQRGDRVVIQLKNSIEAVVSIYAVLKAGAAFVIVHPTTKPHKLRYLLNDSRAAALICEAARADALAASLKEMPFLRAVVCVGVPEQRWTETPLVRYDASAPRSDELTAGIDLDLAAIIYTSGSTGGPKGVMLTHLNIVASATTIAGYLGLTEADIILNTLPLSFDYGLYQVLLAVKSGATVVLEPSFAYPHVVLQTLVRERATGFPIVPTMAAILRQFDLTHYDLSSLRYITNTGAPLPVQHVRELRTALPHVRLFLMYGLTECKRVSYLSPDQVDDRPDSVGRGLPNQELYLVDEQGNRLEEGTGELVIRGKHVMRGYWERPEETDRVLKPGPLPGERVLYSGDIFRRDADGYLYFLSRKDDIIKTRGEKVSPKEIENVLHALSGVAQAVVVGVPDVILGEAVKAIVSLVPGSDLTAAKIRRHCAMHLEDFMVPKFVEICAALPTTTSGKIDRRTLCATPAE